MAMRRLLTGPELDARVKALGVSTAGLPFQGANPTLLAAKNEPELQRRVMEAERHLREGRLWWVAVLSAVASVASACAAWAAWWSIK